MLLGECSQKISIYCTQRTNWLYRPSCMQYFADVVLAIGWRKRGACESGAGGEPKETPCIFHVLPEHLIDFRRRRSRAPLPESFVKEEYKYLFEKQNFDISITPRLTTVPGRCLSDLPYSIEIKRLQFGKTSYISRCHRRNPTDHVRHRPRQPPPRSQQTWP